MTKFLPVFLGFLYLCAAPAAQAFDSTLWKDRIASNDAAVRNAALNDLHALNKEEKSQAASILGSVLHRGPIDAERAALALAVLGPDAEPALLDLVYALGYDEESVAVAVSSAIIPLGGHAVGALGAKVWAIPIFFVPPRSAADSGTSSVPGVGAGCGGTLMVEALNDPQYEVQMSAAENALAESGTRPLIPCLNERHIDDGDEGLAAAHVVQLS